MKNISRWGLLALVMTVALGCPAPTDSGTGIGGGGGGGGTPDTTAPVFVASPSATPGSTKASVSASINEAGKLFAIAVADNSAAPSVAQTKAGLDYGAVTVVVAGSLTGVVANTVVIFQLNGLTGSTAYDVYVVAEDNAGNLISAVVKLDVTTNPADNAAPVFTPGTHASSKTTLTVNGTIDENARWWALLVANDGTAPTVAQVQVPANYTGEVGSANQATYDTTVEAAFTGLTEATEYDAYLVFADVEGNESLAVVKVDVLTLTPLIRLITAAPNYGTRSYADGGKGWLEIQVLDASGLGSTGEWKVKYAEYNTAPVTFITKTNITTASWTLLNNDIIRIHEAGYSGTTDAAKTDNNSAVWDFEMASGEFLDNRYSIVWIEDGSGSVLDLFGYTSNSNTSDYWVAGDNLTFLTGASSAGHWPSSSKADRFNIGDDTIQYARLKASVTTDGQSASDWESYAPPSIDLTLPSATPSSLEEGYVGTPTIDLAVTVATNGGVTVTSIVADASSISTGATSVVMTDGNSDGIYTATVTANAGLTAGAYTIDIEGTGTMSTTDTATINFGVSAGPVLAFSGADFENGLTNGLTYSGGTASASTTLPYAGTYSLKLTGSPTSNSEVYKTQNTAVAASGYTKITFYLKGTSTKPLVIRFGSQNGSGTTGGGSTWWVVNDTNIVAPIPSVGSPNYTGGLNQTSWVKITLNLGSYDPSGLYMWIRYGSSGEYNLDIDNVMFE